MRYSVLVEPVEEAENLPGFYYAHVPSLGITTHGDGVEGALAAARDQNFQMIKAMTAMTAVKVVKEEKTADGGAKLTVTGVDADKKVTTGTVMILKEGGAWKVGAEDWKSSS